MIIKCLVSSWREAEFDHLAADVSMVDHHQSLRGLLHAVEVSQAHPRPLLAATFSLLLALYKLDLDRSGGTILNKQILNVSLVHVLRDAVEVDDLGVRQDPINQSEISIYCISQSEAF